MIREPARDTILSGVNAGPQPPRCLWGPGGRNGQLEFQKYLVRGVPNQRPSNLYIGAAAEDL